MGHHWNNDNVLIRRGEWILLLFLIFILSCRSQNEHNQPFVCFPDSIVPAKIYSWNLKPRDFIFFDIQAQNNDTFLIFNPLFSNKLHLLYLNHSKCDSIVIPQINRNYSFDFIHYANYISDDSINVFINLRGKESVDFKFLTINRKGQIKHVKEPIKKTKQLKYYYVPPSDYEIRNGYFAFLYSVNITSNNYYDLSKRKVGIYNIKKDSLISFNLNLPELTSLSLKNLDNEYFYPFLTWINDSTLLISFRFSNKIVKYNIFQNTYEIIKPVVMYMDTDLDKIQAPGKNKGFYLSLKYFPSLKIYTRTIELSYEYKKKFIDLYYDEFFNLIGIKYNPKKYYFEKLNKIYSFGSDEIFKLFEYSSMQYDTCCLLKIDSILQNIKKQQEPLIVCVKDVKTEKDKLKKLVEHLSISIPYDNYQLLVLSQSGCHSCVEFVLKLFVYNKAIFSKHPPLVVLYIGNTEQYYEYFRELSQFKSSFIMDNEGNYELFFNSMNINPIILTIQNKKLNKITPFDVEDERNSKFLKALFDD